MEITDPITITGPGSAALTIDADKASRIFVTAGSDSDTSFDVAIEGLTLINGDSTSHTSADTPATTPSAVGTRGGSIFFYSSGNLTLDDVVISGSSSPDDGGAILHWGVGDLIVNRSRLTGNTSGANGGAIYSRGTLDEFGEADGAVRITDSQIDDNTATDKGGALISYSSTVTILRSTISGNKTTANNGTNGGGGIYTRQGDVAVVNSTVSGNRTARSGGAISARTRFAQVDIVNSTISGNTADINGGGVYSFDSSVALRNSTVTLNEAKNTDSLSGIGGGLDVLRAGENGISGNALIIRSSIVAGNIGTRTPDVTRPRPLSDSRLIVEGSLIGDNKDGGAHAIDNEFLPNPGSNTANLNLVGDTKPGGSGPIDPLLGPLTFQGGPTRTHALLVGSPAIEFGRNNLRPADTFDLDGDGDTTEPIPTDQRGLPFLRIADGVDDSTFSESMDIGAYERQTLDDDSLFIVTTLTDELDYSNNDVSLREALNSANGSSGADAITFQTGLTGTITLSLGELEISDTVIITGPGQDQLTIDANSLSRVMNFISSTGDLTLDGLTLTGGRTTANFARGGGVLSASSGAIFLTNSTLSGNHTEGATAYGGGIYASGSVTLTNSTLSGNYTTGNDADGGGIYAKFGSVTLTNSTVSGNHTQGNDARGGGISAAYGSVTLTNSTLSGNRTEGADAHGGGIFTFDSVTLTNSTLSGNRTKGENAFGGGISAPSVTLTHSTLSGNHTEGANSYGGGINARSATLTNSTLSGNHTEGENARGGGINATTFVRLTNSTLSGNYTKGSGANGGGIFAFSSVTLTNSTISGNSAKGVGGGISMDPGNSRVDESLTVHNSIVAGNTDAGGTAPDFLAPAGDLSQLDVQNSLIGVTTGTSLTTASNGNVLDVDWKTALENDGTNPILKDNGGPTQTIALLADSPAIDQGNNALALDPDGNNLANDQRGIGFDRVLDGDGNGTATVDMGAFEASGGPIQLPAGETTVTNEGGMIFVRNNGSILFQAARSGVTELSFLGGGGDASLAVGDLKLLAGAAVDVTFDGQGGNNRFRLLEQSQALDLIALPDGKLQNMTTIDITGSGANTLTLNAAEVRNISTTTDTLRVIHAAVDAVNYGAGWSVELPQIIDGQFVHVLKQSDTTLEVANTRPFQNPFRSLDVNRDGTVAPLDVLIIINRLNVSGSSSLQAPTSVAGVTEYFYIDTNGDGAVTPIDVILVINFLNNPSGQPEGEGHIETELLAASVQAPVPPSARVAARGSRPDETTRLRNAELPSVVAEYDSVLPLETAPPARVIEEENLSESIDAFFASFLRTDRIQ